MKKVYTEQQGQHCAFIYYDTRIHGCPPAEADRQQYFRASPPFVHRMVLTLALRGFIERAPGQPRSSRLLTRLTGSPNFDLNRAARNSPNSDAPMHLP